MLRRNIYYPNSNGAKSLGIDTSTVSRNLQNFKSENLQKTTVSSGETEK